MERHFSVLLTEPEVPGAEQQTCSALLTPSPASARPSLSSGQPTVAPVSEKEKLFKTRGQTLHHTTWTGRRKEKISIKNIEKATPRPSSLWLNSCPLLSVDSPLLILASHPSLASCYYETSIKYQSNQSHLKKIQPHMPIRYNYAHPFSGVSLMSKVQYYIAHYNSPRIPKSASLNSLALHFFQCQLWWCLRLEKDKNKEQINTNESRQPE